MENNFTHNKVTMSISLKKLKPPDMIANCLNAASPDKLNLKEFAILVRLSCITTNIKIGW
jgi:hypothetical protein